MVDVVLTTVHAALLVLRVACEQIFDRHRQVALCIEVVALAVAALNEEQGAYVVGIVEEVLVFERHLIKQCLVEVSLAAYTVRAVV